MKVKREYDREELTIRRPSANFLLFKRLKLQRAKLKKNFFHYFFKKNNKKKIKRILKKITDNARTGNY